MAHGEWWRYGVIYQIYPRSFADADGDGTGDLAGITAHLDHLNDGTPDSLGVGALWLSPFYPSPMADFGYDVADYTNVDPVFGSLDDFDTLLAEAHRRGIRVIVDLVPHHTSDQHPWFVESRAGRTSDKRDWYVWADGRAGGEPPNNWRSAFERVGGAWTFDPATGQWYLHSFMAQQPDLNWWNPKVRDAMDEVLRFWLDRGVDGFRVDVAHKLAKDPGLVDNPPMRTIPGETAVARERRLADIGVRGRDRDWPEVHAVLRRFRQTLDDYDDRLAAGEVYLLDQRALVRYLEGDGLHLAHNFAFLNQPWRAESFREVVEEMEAILPAGAWPAWFTGNHDHSRVATRYGGPAQARVAAMMLLTLRGTPFLFQGEEIGMTDVPVPPSRQVDVDGRDPERTPVQWDATPNAGFTTGTPWLPVAPDADRVNLAAQRGDPSSTLSLYRRLIWLRRQSPALTRGDYQALPAGQTPPGVYAYVRTTPEERLLVALNFTAEETRVRAVPADGRVVMSTDPARTHSEEMVGPRGLHLGGNEGMIVRLQP